MAFAGTGIPLNVLDMQEWTGTLSSTEDATKPSKIVIPGRYISAYDLMVQIQGEGTYLEGGIEARDGLNFPTAAVALAATTMVAGNVVRLSDTLYVGIYQATNASLMAEAFTISGTTVTQGTAVTVNNGDTDSIAICRINDTTYCIAYNDEVGDDYLGFRTGTVSGVTITQGTEKITAIAPTEDDISIVYEPSSSCIVAAYADASDGVSVVGIPWDSTNDLGTVATATVLDNSSTPTATTIAVMQAGYCVAIYSDVGEDSSKIHGIAFAVSTAGATSGAGTEKTIVDAAGTLCKAVQAESNKVVIGYSDASADPAVIAITTSGATGTTITAVNSADSGNNFGWDFGVPTHTTPIINSTTGYNLTTDDLFCYRDKIVSTGSCIAIIPRPFRQSEKFFYHIRFQ